MLYYILFPIFLKVKASTAEVLKKFKQIKDEPEEKENDLIIMNFETYITRKLNPSKIIKNLDKLINYAIRFMEIPEVILEKTEDQILSGVNRLFNYMEKGINVKKIAGIDEITEILKDPTKLKCFYKKQKR